MMLRLLAILLALGSSPATASDATPEPAAGKILQYEAQGGGMLAAADVDWNQYTRIQLERATVEFREDWVRDQERLNNNIIRETDLAQIRSEMSELLHGVLVRMISDADGYTLSETTGADVLRFTPRITKLDIHAPGKAQVIVGNVLVDSKGSMVLVMEISDSASGKLLSSAWRLEADPDKGFMDTATDAANRTAFKRMMENWSSWFFAMLDYVRTEKPGD